jgi:phosphatidate phosphatase APP1
VIHAHPGRILASYIRDIDQTAERRGAVQRLTAEVERDGSALLLTQDTVAAAEHAAAAGFIPAEAVAGVAERRAEDAERPA